MIMHWILLLVKFMSTNESKMQDLLLYFVDDIETSFVENDIKLMSKEFEQLIILSTETIPRNIMLPSNVNVIDEYINWKNFNKIALLCQNIFNFLTIYISECKSLGKVLPLRESMAILASNAFKANEIKRQLNLRNVKPNKQTLFYSFWFYDCIYLAWLKNERYAHKIISRAHGGDVFEERSSLSGKILFRNFQFKLFDHVYSVSKLGTNYLKYKYPNHTQKISTAYLGSKDPKFTNPFESEVFTIVSCAKIRDIKRIYLIAEALMYIDFPIVWYHLGDENLDAKNDPTVAIYKNNINNLKSKSNVTVHLLGQLNNDLIFNFYSNTALNLFVSLSSTEGIPVSMMEAISYGIPILSTDVGGCNEIVNSETGILVHKDIDAKDVAQIITNFKDSEMNTNDWRKRIKSYWSKTFNQDNNHLNFINLIND